MTPIASASKATRSFSNAIPRTIKPFPTAARLLARPYVNPDGGPSSDVIAGDAAAGPRTGGFVGYSRVELYGEEVNLAAPLYADDAFRLEALAGRVFCRCATAPT